MKQKYFYCLPQSFWGIGIPPLLTANFLAISKHFYYLLRKNNEFCQPLSGKFLFDCSSSRLDAWKHGQVSGALMFLISLAYRFLLELLIIVHWVFRNDMSFLCTVHTRTILFISTASLVEFTPRQCVIQLIQVLETTLAEKSTIRPSSYGPRTHIITERGPLCVIVSVLIIMLVYGVPHSLPTQATTRNWRPRSCSLAFVRPALCWCSPLSLPPCFLLFLESFAFVSKIYWIRRTAACDTDNNVERDYESFIAKQTDFTYMKHVSSSHNKLGTVYELGYVILPVPWQLSQLSQFQAFT